MKQYLYIYIFMLLLLSFSVLGAVTNVSIWTIPSNITINTEYAELYSNVTTSGENISKYNMTAFWTPISLYSNNCSMWYQNTCISGSITNGSKLYQSSQMSRFSTNLYHDEGDDEVFFYGYYPYNYTYMSQQNKSQIGLFRTTNILYNITHFIDNASTKTILEFSGINRTGATDNIEIYYCNSSYNLNQQPTASTSCQLSNIVTSLTTQNHSEAGLIQFRMLMNITIQKTNQSYIILWFIGGALNNGWNMSYITTPSYNNNSFKHFNNAFTTMTSTPNIYFMHIYQIGTGDYLDTYTQLNINNSLYYNSSHLFNIFNNSLLLMNHPLLINPICHKQFTIDSINMTLMEINFSGIGVYNNISYTYIDLLGKHNSTIINYWTSYTYEWYFDSTMISIGNYSLVSDTCDVYNNCLHTEYCTFNICQNNYVKEQTACINNLEQKLYYDANKCSVQYTTSVPSDNGTYISCTSVILQQKVYTTDVIILAVLFLFLLVSLICAILVHEGFFGLCALICSLMLSTFISYAYPQILSYMMIFFIILFCIMWIVIARKNR
jgi:hypothetical protein